MQRLGPYQIVGELGRGGMGTVFHGIDSLIGRPVAIKTLRLSELADPSEHTILRDRLYREAQSAGILSHPGIVTVYQVGEELGVTFIAMEFIDGPTLSSVLSSGARPDPEWVRDILRQAADALDFAHMRGVVHRDIKPANLMLTSGGRLKIADFGIARVSSSTLTRTGMSLGSPSYMSPEQVQALAVDGRSDQYSLAVVACELLGGDKPFVAGTLTALAYKIVHEEPRLESVTAASGRAATAVLRKALSKDPAHRFRNCSDFVEALAASFEQPAAAPPPPLSRRLHPWVLTVAAAAALIAVGAAAVIVWTASRGSTPIPSPPSLQSSSAPLQTDSPSPSHRGRLTYSQPPDQPAPDALGAANTSVPPPPPPPRPVPKPPRATPTPITPTPRNSTPRNPTPSNPTPTPPAPTPASHQQMAPSTPADASKPPPPPEPQAPAPQAPTPPPPSPPPPVRTPPVLLFQVPPVYTDAARRQGLQGEVVLAVQVDERGSPASIQVVRSLEPGLDQRAVEAVRKWRFRPALLDAQPVPEVVRVQVGFHLANPPSTISPSLKKAK